MKHQNTITHQQKDLSTATSDASYFCEAKDQLNAINGFGIKATDRRLSVLRETGGGALLGKSLVILRIRHRGS